MRRVLFSSSALFVLAVAFGGCAKGTQNPSGGSGGSGASSGGQGGTGNTGNDGGSGGSGNTGNVGGSGNAGGTGGSGNSGNDGGSGNAGGSMGCPPDKHLCGGICVGNTPATGCFTSATCTPCPNPPQNGVAVCNAQGTCDVMCNAPYVKSSNSCVCGQACCTDADCSGGGTCVNGACEVSMSCTPQDLITCQLTCALSCSMQGFANGSCDLMCNCTCSN